MADSAFPPSVFDRLLKDRIIWLGSEVRDDNANEIAAKLLLLAAEDDSKDIYLYINSPGGSITAGMAIYDTMQFVPNDIVTVGIGMAASMGQLLFTAGTGGAPKPAMLTHGSLLANLEQMQSHPGLRLHDTDVARIDHTPAVQRDPGQQDRDDSDEHADGAGVATTATTTSAATTAKQGSEAFAQASQRVLEIRAFLVAAPGVAFARLIPCHELTS